MKPEHNHDSPLLEPFPQFCMIASQDHDQIYPALRPGFTSMPVKNYPTSRCQRLQLVE